MKHDWYTNEEGEIDVWRLDYSCHNGPECRRCGNVYCKHCVRNWQDLECPENQLELDLNV